MNFRLARLQTWLGALAALATLTLAGCGGGLDPILGTSVAGIAPTVTSTTPVAATPAVTGVATNSRVTATFSKAMNASSLTAASFSVACPTGTAAAGTVSYDAATRTASFTAAANFAASTVCVATVTTAATDTAGFSLAANFVWSFVTAAGADTVRPTVIQTVPSNGASSVATNTAISATFSEDMNAATIGSASFTLTNATLGTAVVGSVSYTAASRTVVFTPTLPATLPANTTFTATITTAVTDVVGNAMAANFVWSFVTAAVPDTVRPTVILTVPANGASNVVTNTAVSATFSEDMNAATVSGASFTLTNTTLGTAVVGSVSYAPASRTAVFTPTVPTSLPANTLFTATISTAVTDVAGNAMAANFSWTFSTAVLADTTRPTVVLTVPLAGAVGTAPNSRVTATFSEDMNAATLTSASFTLINNTLALPVAGTVAYAAAARTVTFTPISGSLSASTAYTATVSSAATDLAGNGLAGNTAVVPAAGSHVWSFTTAALGETLAPTVTAVSPADGASGICLSKLVTATFNKAMDPLTISGSTFTVTDGGVAVAGTVTYDAPAQTARFVPTNAAGLAASRTFVATVVGGAAGVKDLTGNPLAVNRVWSFSTGTQPCSTGVGLGSAASFGSFGGAAGITNQGINTIVGGNIGTTAACTLMTGFHDAANVYTETPLNIGGVNGSVYCGPPAPGTVATLAIATQALADARAAYNALAALPPGSDPGAGQLGGRVLTPGVYTAAGGTFAITTGDLTLDAQGDANAVWVFQMGAALTVGLPATPRRVLLVNGARAANVYWQVGSAARIEDRSTMVGTIIAPAGVTISTAGQTAQTTLVGRAIGLTASVTMVNTTVVAP